MKTQIRMNDAVRMSWLRLFLRVLSVGLFTTFIPWITLILLNAPILAPGSGLAPLLRFQPYNTYYESMMTAIYIVWAVTLWRASGDPARHGLFIDFTMWANAAHGLVMLIATPMQKGLIMTLVEGVPFLVIAAVLAWLRPTGPTTPAEDRVGLRPTTSRENDGAKHEKAFSTTTFEALHAAIIGHRSPTSVRRHAARRLVTPRSV